MSRLPFELLLALRYLRPKRTFVSVITLISVLGVTLGVAVLIIVISVMSGFDQHMRDVILGFNAHLTVTRQDSGTGASRAMADYQGVMKLVAANSRVKTVAPFVTGQVLMETETNQNTPEVLTAAPWVRGIDPRHEVTLRATNIVEGSLDLGGHGVVVGTNFAEHMRLRVGDRISIYSPRDLRKIRESQGKEVSFNEYEVRGIFDVGYYEYDNYLLITSLQNAQDLYDLEDNVHGLMVMLDNPYQAAQVAHELQESLGPEFSVSTWMDENRYILSAIAVEKNVMFYILFFIMIVAALCILSALITFVVQKTREIGMLKAIGATDFQVAGLFLSQSAFIGIVGVLAGYGLGILAITYRNEFLFFMRRATGLELFPQSIYGFDKLPALIVPGDILLICGSALVICVLGGMIPAWRAGRLAPVEALRYE